ncbi:hypothetical protein GQ53DRAFT_658149 [Thozetella sp. PMI_491]|nr:hypothetical protein GQ53DRAFT_658149 [Thozetella sp. PMI_491]
MAHDKDKEEVTQRYAWATIRNNLTVPIIGVELFHKYSDNYKNSTVWNVIQPGQAGSSPLLVQYNTGFLTTGTDWWFVSWFSQDMKTMYYSNPNNFGWLLDLVNSFAPDVISAAAGAIAGAAAIESGPGAIAAAAGAAVLAKAISSSLFNSESISGFKEYMLTAADANSMLEITILPGGKIHFKSPSGSADTVYSSKAAPVIALNA